MFLPSQLWQGKMPFFKTHFDRIKTGFNKDSLSERHFLECIDQSAIILTCVFLRNVFLEKSMNSVLWEKTLEVFSNRIKNNGNIT